MQLDEPTSFRAYGLTFQSELDLPGTIAGGDAPDVVIRFGTVAVGDDVPKGSQGSWIRSAPGEIALYWEGVGHFLTRGGEEVVLQPAPGVAPEVFQQAVLGPILCLVVLQRGWYPLHASSIRTGNSIIALAGPSGSGKSSLAAALNKMGYPLVADDVTVIDTSASPPMVQPGITALKLWPDSLDTLGKSARSLPRLDEETDKRRLEPQASVDPSELRAVYMLGDAARPSMRTVPAEQAVLHLLDLCQHCALMHSVVGTAGLIPHAARIAQGVPFYRFGNRSALEDLFETAGALERHFKAGYEEVS